MTEDDIMERIEDYADACMLGLPGLGELSGKLREELRGYVEGAVKRAAKVDAKPPAEWEESADVYGQGFTWKRGGTSLSYDPDYDQVVAGGGAASLAVLESFCARAREVLSVREGKS